MRVVLAVLLLGGVAEAKKKPTGSVDGAYAMGGAKEKGKVAGDSLCARPAPGEPIMFAINKGKLTAQYPIGYDGGIVLGLSAKVTKAGAISGVYKAPSGSRARLWNGVKISGKVGTDHQGNLVLSRDGASCSFSLDGRARD
ncbi:MAG TPA: hypothetical protein VGM90_25115 [Kofleriaceae bacterium]|jgi:hypothetical protein